MYGQFYELKKCQIFVELMVYRVLRTLIFPKYTPLRSKDIFGIFAD